MRREAEKNDVRGIVGLLTTAKVISPICDAYDDDVSIMVMTIFLRKDVEKFEVQVFGRVHLGLGLWVLVL